MSPSASFTHDSLGAVSTRPLCSPSTSLPLHRAHCNLRRRLKPTLLRAQGESPEKFWSVADVLKEVGFLKLNVSIAKMACQRNAQYISTACHDHCGALAGRGYGGLRFPV